MSQSSHAAKMTPAGLQRATVLTRRRIAAAFLNIATYLGLLYWLGTILGDQGWSLIDLLIFLCFAIAAPWSVLGVWNALLGLWLLHLRHDGRALVAPFAEAGDQLVPLQSRTAITMTLRNEDPARAFARLHVIHESLETTGEAGQFAFFVLSDSDNSDIVAREQALFTAWKGVVTRPDALNYRRRLQNTGYKAGNIIDFCTRWGHEYAYMLTLDADSVMDGATIVGMVRILQAYPKLGILQSLVVGAPARSPFARLFQFGMRAGMRAYTMGQAWWTADCGPYWGHNAMVRIAAFSEHCHLPELSGKPPFGGMILSHDQVEATFMRRGGFEVRVMPIESGSYEDNPPHVLEFLRRDARWCQGNLQYLKLLTTEGLLPVSRFQLIWAILMFAGLPAFVLIQPLIVAKAIQWQYETDLILWPLVLLYGIFVFSSLMPKLVGYLDVYLDREKAQSYGGAGLFTLGAVSELAFSLVLGAVTVFSTSLFMVGLVLRRGMKWTAQARDAGRISLWDAVFRFAPHTLFGVVLYVYAWSASPLLVVLSLPLTLGFVLSIPFAILTASPEWGSKLKAKGLAAIPEDVSPPAILQALSLLGPDRHRLS